MPLVQQRGWSRMTTTSHLSLSFFPTLITLAQQVLSSMEVGISPYKGVVKWIKLKQPSEHHYSITSNDQT